MQNGFLNVKTNIYRAVIPIRNENDSRKHPLDNNSLLSGNKGL